MTPLPHSESVPATTRRGFLAWATYALSGVIAALAAIPVAGALLSPILTRREGMPAKSAFIPVIEERELKPGVPKRVEISSTVRDAWARQDGIVLGAAWLLKQPSGQVIAFSTVCPHLGCGIDHNASAGRFQCPCHTSTFNEEGARVSGPSPRGMDRLETEVKEGWVRVRYVRFKQGLPKAEEV